MEFSEQVLVLQVGTFRESDLWVRFLSPTRGLLSAFAFGGSRSRRRFVGCLDVFNEISVRAASSGRNSYLTLQEGVLVKGVTRLRRDWSRFGLAVNCVRFLQSFGASPEGAEESLFLMRQMVQLLEEDHAPPKLLPLFFRARLVFDHGYALDTEQCAHCGRTMREQSAFLVLREGRLFCKPCALQLPGHRLPLGQETLAAFAGIHTLDPVKWREIRLSFSSAREIAAAVDGFIQYHVGISWERGRFVRS